jgi:tRNA (guanine37-N1)-methyltransferase
MHTEGQHLRKLGKNTLSRTLALQGIANACNSYDIIGDIVIIRSHGTHGENERIAEAILSIHKNFKTVFAQIGSVCGDFRLRKLEHLGGERRTTTRHRESGCLFSVDVEKCYFSPRLSHERMRVTRQVGKSEVVVNMFAGVGCFSILIAKHSDAAKVCSIDVNPEAVNYMRENTRINVVHGKVVPILGDAKGIIEERLLHVADRVIMPLPEKASEYLPCALLALKKTGGWIHYYDFEHASKSMNAAEKVKLKVSERLQSLGVNFQVVHSRVVRSTGPHWWQVVSDLQINREGSEARPS